MPNVDVYASKLFTHDRQARMLLAEASELGLRGVKRLYNDACDCGLALEHNGNISYWVLSNQHQVDGDIQYWELMACQPSNALQEQYVMRIFND